MKASNTEIYTAIDGSVWFESDDIENLALAIQRAESDPLAFVEVGRMYAAMVYKVVEGDRHRIELRKAKEAPKHDPRYILDVKGLDEVDALRQVGAV